MCRDYPHEISEARKQLWPHYRSARDIPSTKASIRYPARLVVNGVATHDMFPDWFTILKGSRMSSGATEQNTAVQSNGTRQSMRTMNEISTEQSGRLINNEFVRDEHLSSMNAQPGGNMMSQAPPPVIASPSLMSSDSQNLSHNLNRPSTTQNFSDSQPASNVSVGQRQRNAAKQTENSPTVGPRSSTTGTASLNNVNDAQSNASYGSSQGDG